MKEFSGDDVPEVVSNVSVGSDTEITMTLFMVTLNAFTESVEFARTQNLRSRDLVEFAERVLKETTEFTADPSEPRRFFQQNQTPGAEEQQSRCTIV